MGRYLIIANQTLGGAELDLEIRERIDRAPSVFYVAVPVTSVQHEATRWTGGFALSDLPAEQRQQLVEDAARQHEAELHEARQRAQKRLELMIEKVRAAGGKAEGEVGFDDDPVEVARAVLDRQADFGEILLSTLPAGLSRWVRMDVASRLARITDTPVTTIEADDRD
jgi:hypothetical protein